MTSDLDGCRGPRHSRIDVSHLRLEMLAAGDTAALSACASPDSETAAPTAGNTVSTATPSAASDGRWRVGAEGLEPPTPCL